MFKSAVALTNLSEPDLIRVDGKFRWQFADGHTIPAVTGGATATETEVPADLSALSDEEVQALLDERNAEFDELRDEGSRDLPRLTAIADDIDRLTTAQTERAAAAEATEAEIEAQAQRVAAARGEAADDADGADGTDAAADGADGADGTDADAAAAADATDAPAVTAAAGRTGRPGLGDVARRAPRHRRPNATQRIAITAAADLQSHSPGQTMDLLQVAAAFHDRARNLGDTQGVRAPVARIQVPHTHTLGTDPTVNAGLVADLLDGRDSDIAALVASGGWCAPSVPLFELFDIGPDTDGLFDLPGLGQEVRAGVMVPTFYDIGSVGGALWTWTEAADVAALTPVVAASAADAGNVLTINTTAPHGLKVGNTITITGATPANVNGTYKVASVVDADTFTVATVGVTDGAVTGISFKTSKGCLRIPCPTWMESRLEAEGLCVSHGNLQDRAWPELTRQFINIVMAAHLRRMSASKIAKILADSIVVTPAAGMLPSDAAGDLYNVLGLAAADYRSQFRVSRRRSVDVLFPEYVLEMLRANYAMRNGIDKMNVPDATIINELQARNIRAQFTQDWQPLYGASPSTGWPSGITFLMWFTGSYVSLDGGNIDLGVTRDSTLNATNDFTAAWSEQFFQVLRRGPQARQYTVPMEINGGTGGMTTSAAFD